MVSESGDLGGSDRDAVPMGVVLDQVRAVEAEPVHVSREAQLALPKRSAVSFAQSSQAAGGWIGRPRSGSQTGPEARQDASAS